MYTGESETEVKLSDEHRSALYFLKPPHQLENGQAQR